MPAVDRIAKSPASLLAWNQGKTYGTAICTNPDCKKPGREFTVTTPAVRITRDAGRPVYCQAKECQQLRRKKASVRSRKKKQQPR